jgi:hypothetical protein
LQGCSTADSDLLLLLTRNQNLLACLHCWWLLRQRLQHLLLLLLLGRLLLWDRQLHRCLSCCNCRHSCTQHTLLRQHQWLLLLLLLLLNYHAANGCRLRLLQHPLLLRLGSDRLLQHGLPCCAGKLLKALLLLLLLLKLLHLRRLHLLS